MVTGCHFEALLVIDHTLISGDNRRVVRLHDTAVTYLAVLITPIRVVVVTSRQVINLLRYRCILATLCRGTESDQLQTGIVPDLLCRQEVTQRVVLDTFSDDTFVIDIRRETVSQLCCYCPTVRHHTARISCVHTSLVVSVRARCSYFPTLCITAGTHQVVRRLSDTTIGEVGRLYRVQHLFVTTCIIQTTHR